MFKRVFENLSLLFWKRTPVTVNGVSHNASSIVVNDDGEVIIDGNSLGIEKRVVNITITGDVKHIKLGCGVVTVNGNVESVSSASGDVTVSGNVYDVTTASGSVDITGDATNAETVSGDLLARTVKKGKTVSGIMEI